MPTINDAELWTAKTALSMLRKLALDKGDTSGGRDHIQQRLHVDRAQADRIMRYLADAGFWPDQVKPLTKTDAVTMFLVFAITVLLAAYAVT